VVRQRSAKPLLAGSIPARTSILLVLSFLTLFAQSPEQLIRSAIIAHRASQWEEAIRQYRAFLALRPNEHAARSNLGVALAAAGRFPEAQKEYATVLAAQPANLPVRINLGLAFYKAGACAEAIDEMGRVLETNPAHVQARLISADCHLQREDPAAALALLQPMEPGDPLHAFLMGSSLIRLNRIAEGSTWLERLLAQGDSAQVRLLQALLHRQNGDHAAAEKSAREALERNAALPEAHALLGEALLAQGQREAARAAFEQELMLQPHHVLSLARLRELKNSNTKSTPAAPTQSEAEQLHRELLRRMKTQR
jgi:Flp pilus assembly protein TadD